jgi:hypothetical protein
LAVKRQKTKAAKNHYFGIFGLENSFFSNKILNSCSSERNFDPKSIFSNGNTHFGEAD